MSLTVTDLWSDLQTSFLHPDLQCSHNLLCPVDAVLLSVSVLCALGAGTLQLRSSLLSGGWDSLSYTPCGIPPQSLCCIQHSSLFSQHRSLKSKRARSINFHFQSILTKAVLHSFFSWYEQAWLEMGQMQEDKTKREEQLRQFKMGQMQGDFEIGQVQGDNWGSKLKEKNSCDNDGVSHEEQPGCWLSMVFKGTITIDGIVGGNHWVQWFSMVVHYWFDDGMVTYHRWSLYTIQRVSLERRKWFVCMGVVYVRGWVGGCGWGRWNRTPHKMRAEL